MKKTLILAGVALALPSTTYASEFKCPHPEKVASEISKLVSNELTPDNAKKLAMSLLPPETSQVDAEFIKIKLELHHVLEGNVQHCYYYRQGCKVAGHFYKLSFYVPTEK